MASIKLEQVDLRARRDFENSHDDLPTPQVTMGIYEKRLPNYTDGDAACLHFDANGRLLVRALENPETEKFKLELAELKKKASKVEHKYCSKNYRAREQKEQAIATEQAKTHRIIEAARYEFYTSLARWSLGAATIISSCYMIS